jgi:hypothetical protein
MILPPLVFPGKVLHLGKLRPSSKMLDYPKILYKDKHYSLFVTLLWIVYIGDI